jgi:hypothetical protein
VVQVRYWRLPGACSVGRRFVRVAVVMMLVVLLINLQIVTFNDKPIYPSFLLRISEVWTGYLNISW